MEGRREVFAFDFDGTLTRRDTLLEIGRHARGAWAVARWMAFHAPLLAAVKAGLCPGAVAKEMFVGRFFGGMAEREFRGLCADFARSRADLLRPEGMEAVASAVASGAAVLVVTASIDMWVEPFFARFGGSVAVVGTRLEVSGGVLTGRLASPNCTGREKCRRISELFPDRDGYRLTAFGDSRGDREMLAMADEAHYKPFRR